MATSAGCRMVALMDERPPWGLEQETEDGDVEVVGLEEVTGVAGICGNSSRRDLGLVLVAILEIGRASCRERVSQLV